VGEDAFAVFEAVSPEQHSAHAADRQPRIGPLGSGRAMGVGAEPNTRAPVGTLISSIDLIRPIVRSLSTRRSSSPSEYQIGS